MDTKGKSDVLHEELQEIELLSGKLGGTVMSDDNGLSVMVLGS